MKILPLVGFLLLSSQGHAAPKATFSVFGTGAASFAEASCTGLPGFPQGTTLRVPATDARGVSFETNANLPSRYKLVISVSTDPQERTLFLSVAREDTTPLTASTMGLDAGLRTGSAIDAYCELNTGAQRTKNP